VEGKEVRAPPVTKVAASTNPTATAGFESWGRFACLAAAGCFALALGLLVYLADRDASRAVLTPTVSALAGSHWFGALGQWLPSFVHPLAFSLFTAAALPSHSPWQYGACAAWCVINVAFEVGQHPHVSARLADALQAGLGQTPLARTLANYFVRGTFDGGDIVAAILGALAAASVLRLMQRFSANKHAQ
jgi:hypothetical protein